MTSTSRDRDSILVRCHEYLAWSDRELQRNGHFRIGLTYQHKPTGAFQREELLREWNTVLRPICQRAERIRLFAHHEGIRARLSAAVWWRDFFTEAASLLPRFTRQDGDTYEWEVDIRKLCAPEGAEFWLWCAKAMMPATLRPVIVLRRDALDAVKLFQESTDPMVLDNLTKSLPGAAMSFAKKEGSSEDRIVLACTHANDNHTISVLARPDTLSKLYTTATEHATLSNPFLESCDAFVANQNAPQKEKRRAKR